MMSLHPKDQSEGRIDEPYKVITFSKSHSWNNWGLLRSYNSPLCFSSLIFSPGKVCCDYVQQDESIQSMDEARMDLVFCPQKQHNRESSTYKGCSVLAFIEVNIIWIQHMDLQWIKSAKQTESIIMGLELGWALNIMETSLDYSSSSQPSLSGTYRM